MKIDLKNILLDIMMFLAAAFVTSCSDDDSLASRGLETVEMPISISIPAEGFVNPTDVGIGNDEPTSALAVTRALGDPGTYEQFHLPRYIYLFLCNESTNGTKSVIYQKIEIPADELTSAWDKIVSGNDSIYTYKGNVSINLPLNRSKGKIYAAASYMPLHSSGAKNTDTSEPNKGNHLSFYTAAANSFSSGREFIDENKTYTDGNYGTEEDVKSIMFSNLSATDGVRNYMQDIYSSPYNLKNDNNEYYGTLADYASNVPNISMVLYHVATKVDVQWTVDEKVQGAEKWKIPTDLTSVGEYMVKDVTYNTSYWNKDACKYMDNSDGKSNKVYMSLVELRNLPKYGNYLFRPMETEAEGNIDSDKKKIVKGSFDIQLLGKEDSKNADNNTLLKHDSDNSSSDQGSTVIGKFTDNSKGWNTYRYYLPNDQVGMKYYGRAVAYVIPRKYSDDSNNYIEMKLLANDYTTCNDEGTIFYNEDHATKGFRTYLKLEKPTADWIFTPWLRSTIHVTESNVSNLLDVSPSKDGSRGLPVSK